ncbi:MAG: dUTP diphosphatase [Bacteroidales bacterium]|jgi:dUTP pyrophosphatase|nr:dUTP diphosphatase [Bacteroidales bacterium]
MKVKIVSKSEFKLPRYETPLSAGMDLRANIEEGNVFIVEPGTTSIIPTGIYSEIPEGFEAQIRSRSGLAAEKDVHVLNSPGTIDGDYRGEWKVILRNDGSEDFLIFPGDRIAQVVFTPVVQAQWDVVHELSDTERGIGGLGSTGTN